MVKMFVNEVIFYLGVFLIFGNIIVLIELGILDLLLMGFLWFDNIDYLNNSVCDMWWIKFDDRVKLEFEDNGDFGLNGIR